MFRNLKNIPPEELMKPSPSLSSDAAEEVAALSSESPNQGQKKQGESALEKLSKSFSDPLREILHPPLPVPPKSKSNTKSVQSKKETPENLLPPDVFPPPGKKKTQRKRGTSQKRKNLTNIANLQRMVKIYDSISKLHEKYSKLGSHIIKIQKGYNKINIDHPVNAKFNSTRKIYKNMENKLIELKEKIIQQTDEIDKEIVWTDEKKV